jgi:TRAP-type C4-dicarboxylate transport system permease small subunit
MLSRSVSRISSGLGGLAAFSTIVLAVGLTLNIVLRALTRQEIPAVTELSELFFALAGALGFALCELKDGHVAADSAIKSMPARISALFQLIGIAVALVWLFWFLSVSADRALDSYLADERRYGLYPVQFWPVRIAVAIGATALFLQMIHRLRPLLRTIYRGKQ